MNRAVKESTGESLYTLFECASTSNSDSGFLGFPKTKNAKNRNYRNKSKDEDENEENDSTPQEEPNNTTNRSPQSNSSNVFDATSEVSDTSDYLDNSFVINDSDSKCDDEPAVLKKQKPNHKWFLVKEVVNRQLGNSNNLNPDLFYSRCYGSLHCVQRLELMYKLENHKGCVNSLNFHPDGSLLASGSDDLKVVVWDWKCGKNLHIATCARDGQVRLAQVSVQEGLRSSRKLGSHRGPCHKLAVLKDQPQVILSAGEDGIIFRHDLRNSKPERVTNVKRGESELELYSINSHPLNSNEFCVGGRDQMVRTYDQRKTGSGVPPLKLYCPFKKFTNYMSYHVTCALYNHNGSEILASYNDEDIYLFDVNGEEHTFVHQYMGHRNGATIKGVNFFGPNSEYIVSGSDCGNVFFWDRNTEAIVQWFLADDNGVVNCLEPHPQVPYLCTSGLDWDIKVWVPSFESEPALHGLADTVIENVSDRSRWAYTPDINDNDSQMLWMLWRHLSSRDRTRVSMTYYARFVK
ncbi:wd repeat domain-containing family [Holotrichia oblita]|uniref:Wd repeat domain-containing family n=1 Tax=Holotrichia oblita TaxID=644536 RepID=A0ACB9T7R1_HOLOL|nr:wd repeat domain-containing family [Holotrichia oblita]